MNLTSKKLFHAALISVGLFLASPPPVAQAVTTDLADIPLANASTATIRPNIAMVIDDSGSMNREYMPDDASNSGDYCYKWYKYNSLAYNPAQTYLAPMQASGARMPDSVFTNAIKDGYFTSAQKQYDGSTNNGYVDLTTFGSSTITKAISNAFPSLSRRHSASSVKVKLLDDTWIELLQAADIPIGGAIGTTNRDTLGAAIAISINANTAVTGFSSSYSSWSDKLTITVPASQAGLTTTPTVTLIKQQSGGSLQAVTVNPFVTTSVTGLFYATHATDATSTICDSDGNYNIITSKTGIVAPSGTAGSAAALTNYANWYSYYRKRAFLLKAAVAESFAVLADDKFRVGLFFINSVESNSNDTSTHANNDIVVKNFTGADRTAWFAGVFAGRMDGATPLRGALSRMGRMYSGKLTGAGWDPIQYSCQRNYTILSTDGYWNTDYEVSDGSGNYGPYKENNSTLVGKQDGTATRPELDSSDAANTLADVAYYYYHTDLRSGTCISPDLCTDNVPGSGTNTAVDDTAIHQHMTTFTVGLGVDGTLVYKDGYKTSTSGDYFDIMQGTKNWPNPVDGTNDGPQRIDDLWHAAVNGRGAYFSAKDPDALSQGISSALASITSATGSGAAAATSNLQPTTGDNAIYIATYRTLQWDGEMRAYTVDLTNGAISTSTTWEAAALLKAKIGATGATDSRVIYTANGTTRTLFKAGTGGLTATQLAYFDNTKLSQYAGWSADQKTTATSSLMVDFLRGQDRYEDQVAYSASASERLYRDREQILGDVIHSQPIYVSAPPYSFVDTGYSTFKSTNATRLGTLYSAANDGMLHAFDSVTGQERWAYVPPIVLPNLWRLASSDYGDNHHFYLDGPLVVADAKISGTWKTVLIGAMGKGGRGYYALDVTDPSSPTPLWNFTADNNDNVGYSYGTPFVTKLADGTWVAVVTSGYNNIPEGGKYLTADGAGYVFVLNIADGSVLKTFPTGAGSVSDPSGLARLNVMVDNFSLDNTAVGAYGGDLLGNIWRFNFDLASGTAATNLVAFGASKPIMVAPEIADVDGKKVIYFGTGRYLGQTDLTDTSTQSIYAIKDDGATSLTSTTQLQQQTASGTGTTRSITANAVDWTTQFGWYVDLPDSGERVNIDPQMYFGTLVMASTVPDATACQPGGYSWLYQLDYKTGSYVSGSTIAANKFTSPIVGLTVAKLPTGTPVVYPITADGQKPSPIILKLSTNTLTGGTKRVLWRELSN